MNSDLHPAWWIIGLFLMTFFCLYAISRLSVEARCRRRRRRSYQRIQPRGNRPTIMLNVRTGRRR